MKIGLFLLVFHLYGAYGAEKVQVVLTDEKTLSERLAEGLVSYDERESTIAEMFRKAGCEVTLQKVVRKANNVICTLTGTKTDAPPIVVGGHYDFVNQGKGIIDDWSGTSMLVSLYQALKFKPRDHTFLFVAFAKEETGLEGSHKFVHNLDKGHPVHAFVNLECLGTSPMKAWVSRSTPELLKCLYSVAAAFQMKIDGMNVDRVGDDDTHPFKDASAPVLSLHSLDNETLRLIHSKQDRLESISLPRYYESYKLIAFFLAYLDTAPQ